MHSAPGTGTTVETGGADAMIRVLLADDHGVIRDGLGRLIGALDDVELVGDRGRRRRGRRAAPAR